MYILAYRPVKALILAAFVALLFVGGSAVAHADNPNPPTAGAIADFKKTHDTDPHIPLTSQQQALLNQKDQVAHAHFASRSLSVTPDSLYYGRYLPAVQQGQITSYYCGPASVSELLNYLNPATTQSDAAYWLNTTTGGTAWSGWDPAPAPYYTGHPVSDVLNYKRASSWYIPVGLSYYPSPTDVSTYIWRMAFDLDYNYPLVGNAWEVAWGPHLNGHPINLQIFHWFTINGYYVNGNQTDYLDSATTVWSSVPAYNFYFDSPTLVAILGGRGYVW